VYNLGCCSTVVRVALRGFGVEEGSTKPSGLTRVRFLRTLGLMEL